MSDDPSDRWSSAVVLGDGATAEIRPITPDDAAALEQFHVAQSADSRYFRYFSPKPELTPDEVERFTTVDFVNRAAFVVVERGEMIAWASYERLPNRPDAEVAFQVDDGHRGRGIATLLLEHLAAVAVHNGVTRFTAQTLGENRAMLSVFSKAGWPVHRRFESGVIDVDFPLDETVEFMDSVERREQRADSRSIARLLLPASIAVIGASDRDGSIGNIVWQHVRSSTRIPSSPVNPNHPDVGGVATFRSVTEIPGEVGLAVIAVPAAQLSDTIDECIEKRVRGAVVITAIDPSTMDARALIGRARRNGLRIIGPASMGIASPRPDIAIQSALVDVDLPPGNVAISMQSGTLGSSLLRLAAHLRLGVSWFVSLGDKFDVSANDLLQFWEDDDATQVIALYTESLGNPRKFARIARRVSRSRPIVSVRTGAALLDPGNAALYRQTGVIEVPTVAALLDTARVFATQPLMAGNRIAVLSNSRSPIVLTEATLVTAGLEIAEPPVALDWRSETGDYETALRAALSSNDVDAVIVIHAPPSTSGVSAPVDDIERAAVGATKPIVAVMLGAGDGPLRDGSSIPSFAFPEQAAASVVRVAAYSQWRATEAENDEYTPEHIDRAAANDLVTAFLDGAPSGPQEVGELLATYGVEMTPTRRVVAADAADAAETLGFPVAVKAQRRHPGRSVEAGIALDLTDRADVEEAVAIMHEHLGADADVVDVQPMVTPGVDLRIRVAVDERLGPIITVGLGGVQADLIGDEVSRLAPVSPTVARRMVRNTRASAALDDEALLQVGDIVARVAQLASDHAEVAELDLNPVVVSADGCRVVDAAIVVAAVERPEPAVRRLEDQGS